MVLSKPLQARLPTVTALPNTSSTADSRSQSLPRHRVVSQTTQLVRDCGGNRMPSPGIGPMHVGWHFIATDTNNTGNATTQIICQPSFGQMRRTIRFTGERSSGRSPLPGKPSTHRNCARKSTGSAPGAKPKGRIKDNSTVNAMCLSRRNLGKAAILRFRHKCPSSWSVCISKPTAGSPASRTSAVGSTSSSSATSCPAPLRPEADRTQKDRRELCWESLLAVCMPCVVVLSCAVPWSCGRLGPRSSFRPSRRGIKA